MMWRSLLLISISISAQAAEIKPGTRALYNVNGKEQVVMVGTNRDATGQVVVSWFEVKPGKVMNVRISKNAKVDPAQLIPEVPATTIDLKGTAREIKPDMLVKKGDAIYTVGQVFANGKLGLTKMEGTLSMISTSKTGLVPTNVSGVRPKSFVEAVETKCTGTGICVGQDVNWEYIKRACKNVEREQKLNIPKDPQFEPSSKSVDEEYCALGNKSYTVSAAFSDDTVIIPYFTTILSGKMATDRAQTANSFVPADDDAKSGK